MIKFKPVARALSFDVDNDEEYSRPVVFSGSIVSCRTRRKRGASSRTPTAATGLRRSTRTCVLADGFRQSYNEKQKTPKKQKAVRKKKVTVADTVAETSQFNDDQQEDTSNELPDVQIPHTPIQVLRRVGISLGIEEDQLMPAKLMVEPKKQQDKNKK